MMQRDDNAQANDTLSPVKRALLEIRDLRAKLEEVERARSEPIAIVGMGCRLPGGVRGPQDFWNMLCDGVDAISEIPADRWAADAFFDADPAAPGRMSTRWGGFIDGIDLFDPGFFGISPREAMSMDPQQRLLLEVAWESLEHAGHAPDRLRGTSAGVFMGISSFDYVHLAMSAPRESLDSYLAQGIAHSAASGRLAYVLGTHGPAISVDTACSSSLLAVHLAVQSLRRGECNLALAGGVNAILLPTFLIGFSKSQMMAADGRCKSFDARADGFVRGEGCGVVVLKRLSDAEADGDDVWAVIRGSAANQDGRSSGMTAPNGRAQEAVLRDALRDARVEARHVGYVEAHGTGTALGDPIEVQALGAVFGRDGSRDAPLRIGSLKTNMGHLEAAAGVTSVIKAALALRHGRIPASLHFAEPNPYIAWHDLAVEVAASATPYDAIDGRRIAGVSSFGFTGTNVHVVLEGATRDAASGARTPALPLHLLKLSARGAGALQRQADRWRTFLQTTTDPWGDICSAANTGRADLPDRIAIVASNAADAATRLASLGSAEPSPGVFLGVAGDRARAGTAFLFSGHGSQRVGMGRQLYETQPAFRAALDECDLLLRAQLERPLLSVMYPAVAEDDALLVHGMTYSQPALFAVEYALAMLWRSWGVQPAAVLGHSVGEYAAACVAGVFSLADGLRLVAARGRLMDTLPQRGAMLAVFLEPAELERVLASRGDRVAIAAINGPGEVVLSGDAAAIDEIAALLSARGTECRQLAVAQAAHSHLLDPILDDFEAVAATVQFNEPAIPLVSCTTGLLATAEELRDPRYWRRHLRSTVRFDTAIRTVHDLGCNTFLEIGPHTALAGMAARCLPDSDTLCAASMRRDWDEWQQMLESLGALYARGVDIDWRAFEARQNRAGGVRRHVAVPTYAWTHRSYWLEHARSPLPPASSEATWNGIVGAGRRQERQGPLDLALATFPDRWHALSQLSTAIIAATLRELGAFAHEDTPCTATVAARTASIEPRYDRLFSRWLRRLATHGLLRLDGDTFCATAAFAAVDPAAAWRAAETASGDWPFMLEYLQRCQALLPAVLTGRANALETIFPGGSFELAEQLYRDSVMPRYFNEVAGAVIGEYVRSTGRAVRVLEAGGGSAGTTGTLLPTVEACGGTYVFTDVSELFLSRAAERFSGSSHISFGLFDIDGDPGAQGYSSASFDIVVAANVLHAASDIPEALRRMRSLLVPGGLLVLIEVTTYLDWFDVSTALLEGWDRQDDALRPDHPMLSSEAWLAAMGDAGFTNAAAFPHNDSPASVMAQHVLVARTPVDAAARVHDHNLPAGAVAATSHAAGNAPPQSSQRRAARASGAAAEDVRDESAIAASLAQAPGHEYADLLLNHVRVQIASLLRLDSPDQVPRHGRLMDLGLDSLMAVELRGRLSRGLPLVETLPATLMFDYPTADAIVGLLLRTLQAGGDRAATAAAMTVPAAIPSTDAGSTRGPQEQIPDLETLSDEEVEARLLARLASIEESAS